MKIKNNQGQLVTVPKQHEKTVKAMIAEGQHDKVSDLVNSFSKQQPTDNTMWKGGTVNKKHPMYKKLLRNGGILRKADNGMQQPTNGTLATPGFNEDNAYEQYMQSLPDNQQRGDANWGTNPNFRSNIPNLEGYRSDYNTPYNPPTNPNIPYNGMPKMEVPTLDTRGLNQNGTIDTSGLKSQNNPVNNTPDLTKQSLPQKQKPKTNGWDSNNYQDQFGHSGNYWGDFAAGAWKATDALAHAIPDTIGDIKSNRYTNVEEQNNIKRTANPFQPLTPNTGTGPQGQQMRKLGGKIMDYKADGGNNMNPNVLTENNEVAQLPNGAIDTMHGETHAGPNGGIPMNLPTGTRIFSEKLKDPDTKKSYAKMAKKFETAKEQKILDDVNSDKMAKETAKMQMDKKNQESDILFRRMETNKLSGLHGEDVKQQTQQDYMPEMQAGNGAYIPSLEIMSQFEHERGNGGWIPSLETMAMFEHNKANGGYIPSLETIALHERFENGGLKKYDDGGVKKLNTASDFTPQGTTDFSTQEAPYFDPNDREAFGKILYAGDTAKSPNPLQKTFGLGFNKSPYLNDPTKAMTELTQIGFRPKDGNWAGVKPEDIQDHIFNMDKGQNFKILGNLYDTYHNTAQGYKQFGNKDWSDLSEQDKKDFFEDNIYGVRTGLAQNALANQLQKLPVTQTQQSAGVSDAVDPIKTGEYNATNNRKGLGMLPSIVGIPNPEKDAAVNFRHINPNPINYRPESNINEINEIQGATAKLSRFLPTTAEGVGDAANMAANAYNSINKSNENLYNLNQRGKFQTDEANQRNEQGVNEFNAKNDLEQLNHITGREFGKGQQSIQDRKEALNQINTNSQFSNTADWLGHTIAPLTTEGGPLSSMIDFNKKTPEEQDNYYKEIGKRITENIYGRNPEGKMTSTGKVTTEEKPQTQRSGGRVIKPNTKVLNKLKNKKVRR